MAVAQSSVPHTACNAFLRSLQNRHAAHAFYRAYVMSTASEVDKWTSRLTWCRFLWFLSWQRSSSSSIARLEWLRLQCALQKP